LLHFFYLLFASETKTGLLLGGGFFIGGYF